MFVYVKIMRGDFMLETYTMYKNFVDNQKQSELIIHLSHMAYVLSSPID